jgi:3-oxoacyl-[acyl-carrier-protein] synthase-3
MKMEVGISGVGFTVPQKILTNQDLEKMVDTSDEWIVTRTGIRERHIMQPGETITGLVIDAAQTACKTANVDSRKLDFVISSTLTPDRISPAQSFEIAKALECEQAFCFDMNSACSGLMYGLAAADSFLKTRSIKNGIVTAGEHISRLVDYTDRNSCVLFGDAAAAVTVTNDHPEHLIIATELGSDPTLAEEVTIGGVSDLLNDRKKEFYFNQNGKVVFRFAVNIIKHLYNSVPQQAGIKPEQIRYIITHQANNRIIEAAAKEIVTDKTEFIVNLDRYGNTSSASIGVALGESWNRFQKGDYILMMGFGGGLSWGAALVEW